ncbi:MAG: alpha/beta hydrolase [Verrucomicrobia bacterium]|nr:alpha/beta hydrolase [Verrucomicrobiota bacterium]MDA1068515.1 alpha/beta hydrolase [Verrucomicrobiota bacterium]
MKTLLPLIISLVLTGVLSAQDPEVVIYKKVEGRNLALFIFKPEKQSTPSPAIVWYHGGGWREGKAGQFFEHGKTLTGFGIVSISVEYRGYVGDSEHPDISPCIKDAKSAFRWVRAHAKELNIDPDRIAVGGGSAGGHLAAAVATLPGFDSPNDDLGIPLNPSLQLLFNPALDPSKLVGEKASPLQAVKKGIPPAIIFHGMADTTVPITQAYDYQRAMDKVGSQCEIFAYRDQTHGFFNYNNGKNPYYYKTVGDMLVFLDKHGYLTK